MTVAWVNSESVSASRSFEAVHAGLTVAMIQTPRVDLKTCNAEEPIAAVVACNDDRFDHLPVLDPQSGETRISGLLHLTDHGGDAPRDGLVRDHCTALTEDHVIGENASILDFVVRADTCPCRLVFSGARVSGLVTLSDLQKLPVRAALFALITGFEMTMTETIRRTHASSDDWLPYLSQNRRTKIDAETARSRETDGFVDSLLFTQFCDKRDIIAKSMSLGGARSNLHTRFRKIENLRNALAHANSYAATPEDARQVCATVRSLLELQKMIGGRAA